MLRDSELHIGDIYMHDNQKTLVRLMRVVGDSESGGAVAIEMSGKETVMGLALFMRKFNPITVQELPNDATKEKG